MGFGGDRFPIIAATAILAVACAAHRPLPSTESAPAHSWYWVDLRAGWRVRVVTPVLKSGGHLVKAGPLNGTTENGDRRQLSARAPGTATIDLKTGKDFIGYEVSLYSVKARRSGGVRVAFRSAEINMAGEKMSRPHSVAPLFRSAQDGRFVRILHLAWGNHGDHDAAILVAGGRDSLKALTRKVESDPSACVSSLQTSCSWIPAGIAVIPERKESAGSNGRWVAAY